MDSWWQLVPLGKSECLSKSIQMQISIKPKILSKVFLHFWNLHQIPNIYKKNEPHSWFISEVIEGKMRGYLNA